MKHRYFSAVASMAAALVLIVLGGSLNRAHGAEDYPSRVVRLIIPHAPGGPTDITARIMAQRLSESLGQQFIVDNRPGAAGIIGTELAAKASPDGYTLVSISIPHTVNPALYKNIPYDTLNDFSPVAQFTSYPNILVVHPSVPAKSVKELIALAKAAPGQLNYGSGGIGTSPHLSAELFRFLAGVNIVHVPYKGGAASIIGVRTGEITILFSPTPSVMPHIKAGKIRALAVTSAKRWPLTPEFPTVAESGLPGYEVSSFVGMLAPARTPTSIVGKVNSAVVRVLQLPQTKEQIAAVGAVPIATTPEQFGAFLKAEVVKWNEVIRESGMKEK